MKIKYLISLISLGVLFLATGCIEKTLYPKAVINVAKVEPNVLIPTATDTASLPQLSITLDIDTPIPVQLVSYSVIYKTNLGQVLPELTINDMPYYVKLKPTAGQTISVNVYTKKIVELLELTSSNITPLMAFVYLKFTDANNNIIVKEAVCQLYPYENTNQGS